VSLGRADLLFDEVEVVEQPFPRRGDTPLGRDRRRQQIADVDQNDFVRGQPPQQVVRRSSQSELVRGRKRLAVLFHLIGTEQLRSQRRLFLRRIPGPPATSK
jgi:hypothetical protein